MPSKHSDTSRPPTNYRQQRRDQDRQLLLLVIGVLVLIGTALIGLIWGMQAALTGGLCLLGGAIFISGLWLLLSWIQKKLEE